MAARTVPRSAQKSSGQLITGALWNAGEWALGNFLLNVPMFRGRQSAAQTTADNVWLAMSLDVTDVDTDSGHSNSVNNSRYTCQVPGWYYVEGYFALASGGNLSQFECAIAKNGSIVVGSPQFLLHQVDLQSLMAGSLVQLAVGDYVETWGRQHTGGNLNTFAGTDLCPCMNLFWVHS